MLFKHSNTVLYECKLCSQLPEQCMLSFLKKDFFFFLERRRCQITAEKVMHLYLG